MTTHSTVPDILKNINTVEEQFEAENLLSGHMRVSPVLKPPVRNSKPHLTKSEQAICDNATD